MLKNILVPVDFSKSSFNALATATAIAQQQGAALTIMHVVDTAHVVIPPRREAIPSPVAQMASIADERLHTLRTNISERYGISVDTIVEGGVPAYTLCRYALAKQIDLIVMGTRDSFSLRKMMLGSTAYRMVKHSPCPVLSVPSDRLVIRFGKIVFPVRNAPNMMEKYEILKPIIKRNNSSIVVAGLANTNDAKSYKYVNSLIDKLSSRLKDEGISYSSTIHFCDSISKRLLEISQTEKPDLIVITAMASSSLRRFFLEYYTKNIVNSASCPVLSIRPDMAVLN
jgi:nucleotide-binding universal stress UspA family protein